MLSRAYIDFAPCMGKQFDRIDIGIAVDDPPGHHRTRISLLLADLFQPRHKIGDDTDIKNNPQYQRQEPADSRRLPPSQSWRRNRPPHRPGYRHDLHHRFANCKRGLHDLRRNPAGKFIGKEIHALLEQISVHLPAGNHRIIAKQGLVNDQRMQQGDQLEVRTAGTRPSAKAGAIHAPESPRGWLSTSQSTIEPRKPNSITSPAASMAPKDGHEQQSRPQTGLE